MISTIMRTASLAACALVLAPVFSQPLAAEDLNGTWSFSWNTDDGIIRTVMEVVQDGNNLTATMGGAELKGIVTDETFTLAGDYFADAAGYEAPLRITGKQRFNSITGDAVWDDIPLTFRAVRKK